MLWTEEVIKNNTISFSIFDNEMWEQDNGIKSAIWSDMVLLVSITLLRLTGKKKDNVIDKKLCFLSTWC